MHKKQKKMKELIQELKMMIRRNKCPTKIMNRMKMLLIESQQDNLTTKITTEVVNNRWSTNAKKMVDPQLRDQKWYIKLNQVQKPIKKKNHQSSIKKLITKKNPHQNKNTLLMMKLSLKSTKTTRTYQNKRAQTNTTTKRVKMSKKDKRVTMKTTNC
jgi:hypothetical protein